MPGSNRAVKQGAGTCWIPWASGLPPSFAALRLRRASGLLPDLPSQSILLGRPALIYCRSPDALCTYGQNLERWLRPKCPLLANYSVAAARAGIGNYFAFYNGRRPHTALYRNAPDNVYFES
jgi:hypothetical protein